MAKSNRKQVLGRGLSAILNDPDNLTRSINKNNSNESIGKIIDLPLEKIITNSNQPRTHFNEEGLKELSKSIQTSLLISLEIKLPNLSVFRLLSFDISNL